MNTENHTIERASFEPAFCSLFEATFFCEAKKSVLGPEMLYTEK